MVRRGENNQNAMMGTSRYLIWPRELPGGARQRGQISKILPEQPDEGDYLCKSGRIITVIRIGHLMSGVLAQMQ